MLEAIILGDGGKIHTEIVRLLVAVGATVNITDRDAAQQSPGGRDHIQKTYVFKGLIWVAFVQQMIELAVCYYLMTSHGDGTPI